jgi:hypothetical protein
MMDKTDTDPPMQETGPDRDVRPLQVGSRWDPVAWTRIPDRTLWSLTRCFCPPHGLPLLQGAVRAASQSGSTEVVLGVNVDHFADVGQFVDCLILFRRRRPDVPVVIVASRFERPDISLERLPIADATSPASQELHECSGVLDSALQNNLTWRSRIAALSRADREHSTAGWIPPLRSA